MLMMDKDRLPTHLLRRHHRNDPRLLDHHHLLGHSRNALDNNSPATNRRRLLHYHLNPLHHMNLHCHLLPARAHQLHLPRPLRHGCGRQEWEWHWGSGCGRGCSCALRGGAVAYLVVRHLGWTPGLCNELGNVMGAVYGLLDYARWWTMQGRRVRALLAFGAIDR
ncbi:hypothetical protein VTK56DRAFT_818 [Thermocarpiscus australiensis]